MPKLAANLTMLFTEVPFLDRFDAAARAGFKSVEFLFPYELAVGDVQDRLERNDLRAVLFNLPSGNWAAGDRGIGADPTRKDEFRAGVQSCVDWAKALRVPRVNCLAGRAPAGTARSEQLRTMQDNVRYAAERLGEVGVDLMIEPINHFDIPGFVLNTTGQVLELIDAVGVPNVYLQYDIYHAQREEGNLTPTLRDHFNRIGHIQIADNPGRHQPGTGEINYPYLFGEIDRLGYQGYVSLEYVPEPNTTESLGWIATYPCELA